MQTYKHKGTGVVVQAEQMARYTSVVIEGGESVKMDGKTFHVTFGHESFLIPALLFPLYYERIPGAETVPQ